MNTIPDSITINVRDYSATYIATAKEVKVRATCTAGYERAAWACAEKVYGAGNFTLTCDSSGAAIYVATKNKISAWRKLDDLPDSDIEVLVRQKSDTRPVAVGACKDGGWDVENPEPVCVTVTGWMYLADAARILDAATI